MGAPWLPLLGLGLGLSLGPGAEPARAGDCPRAGAAEAWLRQQVPRWEARLRPLPGYERPDTLIVCLARAGHPHVREGDDRLWLRRAGPTSLEDEDRLSLAHEYLHLAFRHHPAGHDERFIEDLARALVLGVDTP